MVAPAHVRLQNRVHLKSDDEFPFPINGPAYVRAHGRIYELTANALKSYYHEYGLGRGAPLGFNECLDHIAGEMEIALGRKPKPIGIRGRLFQYESSSLQFKVVGSKVTNIRISLLTGGLKE